MKHPIVATIGLSMTLAAGFAAGQAPDLYDPTTYRTFYLTFAQSNWFTLLQQNYVSEVEIPGTLTVDGIALPNVGVRIRGNTSYTQLPAGSQKVGLNIKTDSFVPGQDLLGYDHINLNNGFHDPTFIREFLTYYIMRQYGPAPRCNFVRLYINNQFWGVYINVQQPNAKWAGQWFRTNDGNRYRGFPTTGGFQNGRCALTWLGSVVQSYLDAYQAKQGDGTDLMQLCNLLNNTPNSLIQATVPTIFSVDQFYRYAACMSITTNTDSYLESGKDHFLYHDTTFGQFHMFPFDLNEALAGSTTLSMWYQTTLATRPAFSKTLTFADWNQRYIAHYRTMLEDTWDWNVLGPLINQYHAMIDADVLADPKKIYTYAQFNTNVTAPVTVTGGGGPGGGSTTVPGLQPLITGRRTYLLSQPEFAGTRATLTNLNHSPAAPTPQQSVCFTVQASSLASTVTLFYRTAGPFLSTPMFDDGNHCDGAPGDGTFGVTLPAVPPGTLVEYYAAAATAAGRLTFAPKTAEHHANAFQVAWPTGTSPARINELLAQNTSVITDGFGEFEDYVELYNASSAPVTVGGMYLTDDLLNPTKFQLPAGQTLPANGTLLVWCDEDAIQGPLHANFKLSAGGESVSLFASDGVTLLDSIAFGAQVANVSTGRLYDGGLPFVSFPTPTPGAVNELTACGARAYTALAPTSHVMTFTMSGTAGVGTNVQFQVGNGPASGFALLFASGAGAHIPVAGTPVTLLVDPTSLLWLSLPLDGAGAAVLPVTLPSDPALAGLHLFLQVGAPDGASARASRALDVRLCP